ncbi:MAG: head-tail connector protein [Bacteroides sp.]|nr:head-tail connector protein [Bacteroides sp.]
MKLSETGLTEIKDYCGITDTDSDNMLTALRSAAISFILNQTGLSAAEAEKYDDLSAALLVLVYDMYLNRAYSVDRSAVNPIVGSILAEHSRNLL